MGKVTNFKFFTRILSIDRNKSPLQISGKVAGCVVRTRNFSGHPNRTHILGASRGLCDSSAVLFEIACRPSVRPSVTFRYRDHISWNSSKIPGGPKK